MPGTTPSDPPDDGSTGSTRSAVAGAGTIVLVLVVLAVSIFFSLPSNVLSARNASPLRVLSARLLPQSWAFFTKPPSDPEVIPYRVGADGSLTFASLLPNSKADNLYGLSRRQRAQGPEIASMANEVDNWTSCPTETCVEEVAAAGPAQSLRNGSKVPTLCGPIVLVETKPVPWAFRHDYHGWRISVRAALVEAVCS